MSAQPPEPAHMRISDADRHRVTEVLREAAAEGRLDWQELDERIQSAHDAKVYSDLVPIVADLPGSAPVPVESTPAPVPVDADAVGSSWAVMGGVSRKGQWRMAESHVAVAVMGGVDLDLREAVLSAPETVIHAYAVMGGIDIYVNAGTRLIVEGIGIAGGFDERDKVEPELAPNAPVVRVKGLALMGGVGVTRKRMPGETRNR